MKLLGKILAVVVLIAAGLVLTTPSPRYFKSKARVSEARSGLAALYTLEKKFYSQFQRYTDDLNTIGYKHEGSYLRYVIGFSPNCSVNDKAKFSLSDKLKTKRLAEIQNYFSGLKCPNNFPNAYEAWAVGDIGGERLDVWKIDEQKNIVHVQDGIPR